MQRGRRRRARGHARARRTGRLHAVQREDKRRSGERTGSPSEAATVRAVKARPGTNCPSQRARGRVLDDALLAV